MSVTLRCKLKDDSVEYTCLCSLEVPAGCESVCLPEEGAESREVQVVEPGGEPWLRLAKLWVACWICSGLVPGMSVFVDMFAHVGIFGCVCKDEEAETCDEQYMVLSGVFNVASAVTLFALLPIGVVFDRYGARACAVSGAAVVVAGLLLLQVPVVGAMIGCDAWTAWVFPLAVMVTDAGSLLNSQCMLGAVWHFPTRQSFVISLSNSSYQAASLLPLILQWLMPRLNLSLSGALLLFTSAVMLALRACQLHTPSQEEFLAEAKRVLGIPLPPPPESIDCAGTLQRGNAMILQRFQDHRWAIFVSSLGFSYGALYGALSGDYGKKLFGAAEAGDRLAQLYALANAVVGGAVAPLGIIFIDRLGTLCLLLSLVFLNVGALCCIGLATWPAQAAACFFAVAQFATYLTFVTKYILIFTPPNRIGVVQGILFAYAMVWNVPIVVGFQSWMSALPDGPERFTLPLLAATGLGVVGLAAFTLRSYVVGFPELPELLPEDELELAKPFGCRDLEDVCYVTQTEDKRELLKALVSRRPERIRELVARIDPERVAEKMAELDVERRARPSRQLAELVETGADVEAAAAEEAAEPAAAREPDEPQQEASRRSLAEEVDLLVGDVASAAPQKLGPTKRTLPEETERVIGLIRAGDKEGVTEVFLSVPVEELWAALEAMEKRLGPAERAALERDFDRLMPGKELAALLRQRRELKTVVARMAKRKVRELVKGRKG